jgi:hypothetical protein
VDRIDELNASTDLADADELGDREVGLTIVEVLQDPFATNRVERLVVDLEVGHIPDLEPRCITKWYRRSAGPLDEITGPIDAHGVPSRTDEGRHLQHHLTDPATRIQEGGSGPKVE